MRDLAKKMHWNLWSFGYPVSCRDDKLLKRKKKTSEKERTGISVEGYDWRLIRNYHQNSEYSKINR